MPSPPTKPSDPSRADAGTIVLGPFRSGTSLTCRMLDRLGLDFGPPAALWRADRFNPGGFYERLDVNHANGRLLESIGRTIVEPCDPLDVLEAGDRRVLAGADLSWRSGRWALKDPRLGLTLATWIDAGRLDPDGLRLIVVRRDPDAVVASIMAYPTLGRLLAGDAGRARTLVEALDRSAAWHAERLRRPTLGVAYERLLEQPETVARELAAFVGVDDPARIASAAAEVGKRRALLRYYAGRIRRTLRGRAA